MRILSHSSYVLIIAIFINNHHNRWGCTFSSWGNLENAKFWYILTNLDYLPQIYTLFWRTFYMTNIRYGADGHVVLVCKQFHLIFDREV